MQELKLHSLSEALHFKKKNFFLGCRFVKKSLVNEKSEVKHNPLLKLKKKKRKIMKNVSDLSTFFSPPELLFCQRSSDMMTKAFFA